VNVTPADRRRVEAIVADRGAPQAECRVRFKLLITRRVGLTLGLGRSLMHGVAPQMCGRVASPLLGQGAGGRSPASYAASIGGPNAVSLVSEREERWHTFEAEYLAVVCNLPL
jgi:hypothetical protein